MSIKTNYDFNGLNIQDAIIRIDRLWGSSREGWTALVGVYIEKDIPAVEAVGVEGEEDYIPAQEASTALNLITEFNRSASFVEGERGYVTLYTALHDEFGGVEV
jgi:hypothetical protein